MRLFFTVIFLTLVVTVQAQFTHPGMSHSKADLEFVRAKIRAGEEPWASEWKRLQESSLSSLWREAHPYKVVNRGPYNRPDIGATEFATDGEVAYTMALQWYMTRDKRYADKAIELINAWSRTLEKITNHDRQLLVGMVGLFYLNAAEILKYSYKDFAKKFDGEAFRHMVLDIWYPTVTDFVPRYNGNWDAAIIQTMLCMGIYFDRPDIFEQAYRWALDGDTNGAIDNYFLENGQCQESGRDQGHTQMGLGYLGSACEIAWNQGRDLYSAYDSRLAKGFEYTSKFMLGEEVPHVQYIAWYGKPVYGPEISQQGRGSFSPIYLRAYRHYHGRMGMEMPYTGRVVRQYNPEGISLFHMPWTTLMYGGNPSVAK